jgi:hypothetical protein
MAHQESRPNAPQQGEASDRDAHLPHDRDEKAGEDRGSAAGDLQHDHNRKTIEQAHEDTESDVRDTERIGIPNDVPSSTDNR